MTMLQLLQAADHNNDLCRGTPSWYSARTCMPRPSSYLARSDQRPLPPAYAREGMHQMTAQHCRTRARRLPSSRQSDVVAGSGQPRVPVVSQFRRTKCSTHNKHR